MWGLRKTTNEEKLLAYLEERRKENKNNPKKKTSGLAARMQALQELQAQKQEEIKRHQEELNRKKRN